MDNEDTLTPDVRSQPIRIGRYLLHRQIAHGSTASVHIARLVGDEGFSRIVAAKRLLPEFAEDQEFVSLFVDEARVASRVRHPNVVPVLDVVATGEDVIMVQEFVRGATLRYLLEAALDRDERVPVGIAVAIACQVLAGLQAAHDAVDEMDAPLNIVHRDVSPQNIMIALDGHARLLDFGVARATMAAHSTRDGAFYGKLAYAAPEQLRGVASRQSDLYSVGAVMWECLVGRGLHGTADSDADVVSRIMTGTIEKMTDVLAGQREAIGDTLWQQLEAFEPVIAQALAVDTRTRYRDALRLADALSAIAAPASSTEIAAWLRSLAGEAIAKKEAWIKAEETSWRRSKEHSVQPPPRRSGTITHQPDTATPVDEPDAVAPAKRPEAPPDRRRVWIYAVIGLVAMFGFGIAVAMRASGGEPVAQKPPPSPPPAPATTPTPALPVAPVPTPEPAAAAAPPPVETPETAKPEPKQVTKRIVRPVREPLHPAAKTPEPSPAELAAPPAPSAEAHDECNPPYYFKGSKKVFKRQCL